MIMGATRREWQEMGAWDATVFGNDDAADLSGEIADLRSTNQIVGALRDALTTVTSGDDYIDAGDASVALAAAALVAAWHQPSVLPDSAYTPTPWPPESTPAPAELKPLALQVIDRLLIETDNELFELWDEAGLWNDFTADIERYRQILV
jgi:hypothetical protein